MDNCSIANESGGHSLGRDLFLVVFTAASTFFAIAGYNYYIDRQADEIKKVNESGKGRGDNGKRNDKEGQRSFLSCSKELGSVSPGTRGAPRTVTNSIASSLARVEGAEASGNFLSSIFSQMWDQMNVAISSCVKETLDPMLSELAIPIHLIRIDLGDVPIRTHDMFIHRVDLEPAQRGGVKKQPVGIQIDFDLDWDGQCDIMLQATITKGIKINFGVKHFKLSGRMSILLSPLTNELPIVSAVQYGFINPPEIKLDFTGVAGSLTHKLNSVQTLFVETIQSCLAGVLVLPQRMTIVGNPGAYDYLETYQPPVGMVRVTAEEGRGFKVTRERVLRDIPDAYCEISLGASGLIGPKFRTSTKTNDLAPKWEESCDLILYDMDQQVNIEVYDEDNVDADDELGRAVISVRDLFKNNGQAELELELDGRMTGCHVSVRSELFHLSEKIESLSSPKYGGKDQLCGLLTIVVTKAFNIPIPREDADTCVKVMYGVGGKHEKTFYTGTVTEYPGIDALNPAFDSVFYVPLNSAMLRTKHNDIVFSLIDGAGANNTKGHGEIGKIVVTHNSLMKAQDHSICETRPIGEGGAKLEFRVTMCGMLSEKEKMQAISSPKPSDNSSLRGAPVSAPQLSEDPPPLTVASRSQLHQTKEEVEKEVTIRMTALHGRGFKVRKRLMRKDDVPDVYCKIRMISSGVEAPRSWKTKTIKDDTMPQWNERKDFEKVNPASYVSVEAWEANSRSKDELLGTAELSIEQLLRNQTMEVELRKDSGLTDMFVTLKCVQLERAYS